MGRDNIDPCKTTAPRKNISRLNAPMGYLQGSRNEGQCRPDTVSQVMVLLPPGGRKGSVGLYTGVDELL